MLVRLRASTGSRNSTMDTSASGILFRLPTRLYTVADVVLRNLPPCRHAHQDRVCTCVDFYCTSQHTSLAFKYSLTLQRELASAACSARLTISRCARWRVIPERADADAES